jgi:L-iditol 2-dehydrogenase
VLHTVGEIRLEDRDVRVPAAHEVIVRIGAVGVCGSDVHYYQHGRIGDFVVRAPLVLGHESAGEIIAVGAAVADRHVGQRVAVEPGVPDGTCPQCRAGRYNLCPEVRFLATPPIDGALTEFLTVPAAFAHPAPDDMDIETAALAEPVSVGIAANRTAGVQPGDTVLVTGAGPIGLVCSAVARARGAASVVVTDVNDRRLSRAAEFGATATVRPEEVAGLGASVLLECSGAAPAVRDGLRALAAGGRAAMVGMSPEAEVAVPMAAVQNRELQVTGVFRYANTYPAALALLARGLLPVERFITHRFPLAESEAALRASGQDPATLKPMVVVRTP